MQNKTYTRQEVPEKEARSCNIKKRGLFSRFLDWIAKGSEKVAKKGGGCCS